MVMEKKTALEELDIKISLILERYELLKEKNSDLEKENLKLKENLVKLKDEDELKDLELEEIAVKITEAMGLIHKEL